MDATVSTAAVMDTIILKLTFMAMAVDTFGATVTGFQLESDLA